MLHFQCPSCETGCEAAPEFADKLVVCPKCGQSVRVPREAPPEPAPAPDSIEALEASLRKCVADELDGGVIDDLRLFILARSYQGRTQPEIEAELVGWGLKIQYVVELVSSTRRAGNFGVVEVSTELHYGGAPIASWQSPTYGAKKRLAARAARRREEARRLAGLEAEDASVDLGFKPEVVPSAPGPPTRRWRSIAVVVLAVAVVVLGCGTVALLIGK